MTRKMEDGMLERYDGKLIRITTEDGDVFTGEAEFLPSGYGLVEFDRAEESIRIDGVQIFHSEIRKIKVLSGSPAPAPARDLLSAAGTAQEAAPQLCGDPPAAELLRGYGSHL